VMSSSNGIERVDLKQAEFCPACAQLVPNDEL
jgi:predicted Zn-dependent protease